MRFRVLALDFDGTIATDGRVDPEVLAALREARAAGVAVALVTGRILSDLRSCLGSLRGFDAIVAEDGAVLAFPQSGSSRLLCPGPAAALVEGLARQGIPARAGQCIVECDAYHCGRVLELIRQFELPLVIHFNRGRMMVLPQSVSKATGLREALRSLRLSVHNAIAIGDAENDHELLSACEVGVAVAWGSASLRREADLVLEGSGPRAVAGFIRERLRAERLPSVGRRRRLLLGHGDDGRGVFLQPWERNLLIAGDPCSGKSWLTGLLAEQLILFGYSLCIVDPEGDYNELGSLPGVACLGGEDPLPTARDLTRLFQHAESSAVIDLSHTPNERKVSYVAWLLELLAGLRREGGLPHRIVIDEAHYFLQDPAWAARFQADLAGTALITYRVSDLSEELRRGSAAIFVTRETDPVEVGLLHELCASSEDVGVWSQALASLELEEAALLPCGQVAPERMLRFRLAPRLTHHVRHEHKYLDVTLADHLAFQFPADAQGRPLQARSLREFAEACEGATLEQLEGHLQRGDLSRWVADVYHDGPLSARLHELEELYRMGRLVDVNGALAHAVRERYRSAEQCEQSPVSG